MEHLIGQTLGRYKINKLLGKGGMGAVFKALDLELDRDVAVKLMHPEYAYRPSFIEYFRREARAAARMDHPGIVKVYDFDTALDHLYLVMEFIPGVNLRYMLQQLTKEQRWFTQAEAVQLVRESSYALAYAHGLKVLHRDIKPANIMLKEQMVRPGMVEAPIRPVITDLGLAKIQDTGLQSVTAGAAGGTPAYMSPEQAQGMTLDGRSDVYSLGVLLFELTLGKRPFPIRSAPEAVKYHVYESLPKPSTVRPDVDPVLEEILQKALAKEAQERYESAEALGDALLAVDLESLPKSVPPSAVHGSADLFTLHRQNVDRSPVPMTPTPPRHRDSRSQLIDQILVRQPNGGAYVVPLTGRTMRIGRDPKNDVVLNDNRVSRFHALLERDGVNFRIIDQDSANGLIVGQEKIPSGQSARWMVHQTVRIGDHMLQLESKGASVPSALSGGSNPSARLTDHRNLAPQPQLTNTVVDGSTGPHPAVEQPAHQIRPSDGSGEPAPSDRSMLPFIIGALLLLLLVAGGYLLSRSTLFRETDPKNPSIVENIETATASPTATNPVAPTQSVNSEGNITDVTPARPTSEEETIVSQSPTASGTETPTTSFTTAVETPTTIDAATATETSELPIQLLPSPTFTVPVTARATATLFVPSVDGPTDPPSTPIPSETETVAVVIRPTPNRTATARAQSTQNAEATQTARVNPTATSIVLTASPTPIPIIPVPPISQATSTATSTATTSSREYQPRSNEVELVSPSNGFAFDKDTQFEWRVSSQASDIVQSVLLRTSDYYFELVVFDETGGPKGMDAAAKRTRKLLPISALQKNPFVLNSGRSYSWTVQLVRCEGGTCTDDNYQPLGEVAPRRTFFYRPPNTAGNSSSRTSGATDR
ncbi:MAG: protein kinase [Chloroflexota bacterium]